MTLDVLILEVLLAADAANHIGRHLGALLGLDLASLGGIAETVALVLIWRTIR